MANSRSGKSRKGKYTRRGSKNKRTAGIRGNFLEIQVPENSNDTSSNIAELIRRVKTPKRSSIKSKTKTKTKTRKMPNIIGMLKNVIKR